MNAICTAPEQRPAAALIARTGFNPGARYIALAATLFFPRGAPNMGTAASVHALRSRQTPFCLSQGTLSRPTQPMDRRIMLSEEEIKTAHAALNELQVEHRDLNLIVEHLASTPLPEQDQLLIHRLKKRKLLLKDKIYQLERMLVPDIQA
jgi:hypothetical protein